MNENELEDEFSNIFTIGELLSEGGQGKVYRVEDDPNLIIKICTDDLGEPIRDKDKISKLNDSFLNLRLLPLEPSTGIVMPLNRLKNNAGYVMKFLKSMKALDTLVAEKKDTKNPQIKREVPKFLENQSKNIVDSFIYYLNTGASRKRIEILSNLAAELAKIHLNGLVYCDLSYNNIFYNDDDNSVSLIDPDNLVFDGSLENHSIFTEGYGAPEVESMKVPNSILGDCFSFAIVAYKLLTMESHKDSVDFKVDENNDNIDEEVGWDGEILNDIKEEEIDEEEPEEEEDSIFDCIMNYELFDLFKKTFIDGKKDPIKRPSMLSWAENLAKASDQLIECNECHMDYNFDSSSADEIHGCPFCGNSVHKHIIIERWNDFDEIGNTDAIYEYFHEIEVDKPIIIRNRVLGLFDIDNCNDEAIELCLTESVLSISKKDSCAYPLIFTDMSDKKKLLEPYKTTYLIRLNKAHRNSLFIINNGDYKFVSRLRIIES